MPVKLIRYIFKFKYFISLPGYSNIKFQLTCFAYLRFFFKFVK